MAKIWATLFASGGDKEVIPVPAEADGTISVTQGWTPDYELINTNPSYKPVGRQEMNGVLNVVTDSIKQLQLQGAAEWSSLLGAYPNGAEVIHINERWRSVVGGNTQTPGSGGNWVNVTTLPAASETVSGVAENATQTETDNGTAGNFTVTPAKLKNGFAILLAANGYIKFPSWLGGVIIQWGTYTYTGSIQVFTLPLTYPNNNFVVIPVRSDTVQTNASMHLTGKNLTQFSIYDQDTTNNGILMVSVGN